MIELNEKEIAVIMLGTGSAAPTLQRRLPSVAVVQRGVVIMFDAGEGTQIQFRKHRLRFTRLSVLCISHLHGDHVTGIIGMLMSMELQSWIEPLTIIGPPGVKDYIESNRRMLNTFFSFAVTILETEGGAFDLGTHNLVCLPLKHRIFCLGFRLIEKDRPGTFFPDKALELKIPRGPLWGKLQSGISVTLDDGRIVLPEEVADPPLPGRIVTYCSDTRPCDNAVTLARKANLLLYEATFAQGEEEKAEQRGHSTAKEACQVARKAEVNQVILTHISARYNSLPELLGMPGESASSSASRFSVAVARDLDIWIVPWAAPPFKKVP
jgi:ribonuclease Z